MSASDRVSSVYRNIRRCQFYQMSVLSVKIKWWCNPQACFPAIQSKSKNSFLFPRSSFNNTSCTKERVVTATIVPKSRSNKFWTGSATQQPQAAPERALWSHSSVPKSCQKKFCCTCPTPGTQSAPKRAPPEPQYHPKSRQEKICSVSGNTTNTNCTEER